MTKKELEEQNLILVEALLFYVDPANWKDLSEMQEGVYNMINPQSTLRACSFPWSKAAKALCKVKGINPDFTYLSEIMKIHGDNRYG